MFVFGDSRPRIVHRSFAKTSKCSCGKRLPDPVAGRPWVVMRPGGVLCDSCVQENCQALGTIMALIPTSRDPISRHFAIVESSLKSNTKCPFTDEPITPRPFEVVTQSGRYLSLTASEDNCPLLAAALHTLNQTTPAPRPAPVEPPPESPAAQVAREKRERHAEAVRLVATALRADLADPTTERRAQALLDAMSLALQS